MFSFISENGLSVVGKRSMIFSLESRCYHVRLPIISGAEMKLTDVRMVGSISQQGMFGKIISRLIVMCGCIEGSVLTVVVFSIIGVWRTRYSSKDRIARVCIINQK